MKAKQIILLTVVALTMSACVRDWDRDGIPGQGDSNFRLTLQMPQSATPSTYAINYIRENDILWADILVFKVTGNKEEFMYRQFVQAEDIINIAGLGDMKGISASLKPNPGVDVRIVILANVDPADIPAIAEGDEKKDVIDQIQFRVPKGRWHVKAMDDYDPIPMWGESGVLQLDPNRNVETIHMLRTLAKVQIFINKYIQDYDIYNEWGQGVLDFEIKNVYVINGASSGYLMPDPANYDPVGRKVTAPTLPTPLTTVTDPEPVEWPQGQHQLINSIYMAEMEKLKPGQEDKATFLVIEAEYKGQTSFYRLDLIRYFKEEKIVMDLLRNHNYSFNITTVHREGEPTLQDAIQSLSTNDYLDIELTARSVSVVTNGNYYLTTSEDRIRLRSRDAVSGYQLTVETDEPGGWEVSSDDAWIQFTSPVSGPAGVGTVTFDLAATPEGRIGTIKVETRNLTKRVVVEQTYSTKIPQDYLGYGTPELEVYIEEQPFGMMFHEYGNVKYRYTNTYFYESPFPEVHQESPPIVGSCASLNVGGHTDWRMPSYPELRTIATYGYDTRDMSLYDYWAAWDIDYNADPYTPWTDESLAFMSSTLGIASVIADPADPEAAAKIHNLSINMFIHMVRRNTFLQWGYSSTISMDAGYNVNQFGQKRSMVRCVRGELPPHVIPASDTPLGYDLYLARADLYHVNGNVTNSNSDLYYSAQNTGLTYFQYANLQEGDLDGSAGQVSPARDFSCASLNEDGGHGGYTDWRMPTIDELEAIFDFLDDDPVKYVRYRFSLGYLYTDNYVDFEYYYPNLRAFYYHGYVSSEDADAGFQRYGLDNDRFVKGVSVQARSDGAGGWTVTRQRSNFMKHKQQLVNDDPVWDYITYVDSYTTRCVRS